MAIHKISGNDIKNNGGVVKGSFTSSLLTANSIKGQNVNAVAQKGYGGSATFYGNDVLKTIDISTPADSNHGNLQFKVISYNTYVRNSGVYQTTTLNSGDFIQYDRTANDFSRLRYFVGRLPYMYILNSGRPISNTVQDVIASIYNYSLITTNSGTLTLPFNSTYKVYDLFIGNVINPSGNDDYTESITINGFDASNSLIYQDYLSVDYWSKVRINGNALPNLTKVVILHSVDPTHIVNIGRASGHITPTSVSTTSDITTYKTSPLNFPDNPANLSLGNNVGFRYTPNKDAILFYREIDNDNNYTHVVADTIPSGASRTYIPIYKNVAIGTITGENISLELMS